MYSVVQDDYTGTRRWVIQANRRWLYMKRHGSVSRLMYAQRENLPNVHKVGQKQLGDLNLMPYWHSCR